jgi:hypothetical protein
MPWNYQYGYGMTGPVTAAPIEPYAWILTGWDRAIPTRFRATTTIEGFDVAVAAVVGARGPVATSVMMSQPRGGHGPAVTLGMLRKITVDQIIRDGVAQLAKPAVSAEPETGIRGTFRVEGDDQIYGGGGPPAHGRGRDTAPERLATVAGVYNAAIAAGKPPVKAVESELHFTRSTAGRLVGQARKAGLLSPTTQGKTSDAPVNGSSTIRPDPGPSIFRDPNTPWPGEREGE